MITLLVVSKSYLATDREFMFEFRLFENHSGTLLTALNGILKQVSQNQVRHDMYNNISSFDANLARDPTNIVET